jgi:hypothetical protein
MERHWKGRTVSSMLALLVLGCAAVSWAPRPAGGAVLPRVVINEVVTDPQRDWNDTAGGDGRAFVATPGVGTVSSSDEWLEVLNAGGEPVDLTGWRLEFVDSSPASMTVGTGSATLVWSDGSSLACLLPGGRLVVGNPAGSMNNDVRIVLRDDAGAVIFHHGFDPHFRPRPFDCHAFRAGLCCIRCGDIAEARREVPPPGD